MAQADQSVANATFPTVRTDINDNLAALFSQSSGNSAPAVTVAFMPWIDTSSSPAVWKVRNAANSGWITIGTIDASTFSVGGVTAIANGGTGQTTAAAALTALLPSQTGNAGEYLTTNGTVASWATLALGATLQTFTTSGTYTPTSGKASFLVFCTGGGGGGGGAGSGGGDAGYGGGGGGGGTAVRMYTSAEMGSTAAVTVGAAGTAGSSSPGNGGTGGSTILDPDGSGLTLTATGGSGGVGGNEATSRGGTGGAATNSQFTINGQTGHSYIGGSANTSSGGGLGGSSFWAGGQGRGGNGASAVSAGNRVGTAGTAGGVFILEF